MSTEKPISLEKTEALIKGARITGDSADFLRAVAQSDQLRLYAVANTNDNTQFIIANNPRYAKLISQKSGHIWELKNGRAFLIDQPGTFRVGKKFIAIRAGFISSAKRAIADQVPGVIEMRGNHAVKGGMVYSPLTGI